MTSLPDADLAQLYRQGRERVSQVVERLSDDEVATPVPACPGWSVHDVVAHMRQTAEDALAGRLTGPPSDEQTTAQVALHRDRPTPVLLEEWSSLSPEFETVVSGFNVWPAVLDVVSHEHDIQGALGSTAGRDNEVVRLGAETLAGWLDPPARLVVEMNGTEFECGHTAESEGSEVLRLRTTPFEFLRLRLGRRSLAQLAGLNWEGDPATVIDHLVVFGPAEVDLIE